MANLESGILNLQHPIKINGKDVGTLTYDSSAIDGVLFATAESKHRSVVKKGVSVAAAVEIDFGLHLYLGYAAIIAVNPDIDFSDLERCKGHDLIEIMYIGRNFIMGSVASQASSSDAPTETLPASTTQASATSKKSES